MQYSKTPFTSVRRALVGHSCDQLWAELTVKPAVTTGLLDDSLMCFCLNSKLYTPVNYYKLSSAFFSFFFVDGLHGCQFT